MKILIIMSGFFPGCKYGGPPVSVDNFCTLISDNAECYILTHNHDMGETQIYSTIKDGWNKRGYANVKYVGDNKYNYSTFKYVSEELRPDYIYLQGLFQKCIFPCLRLAKKLGIKVVLAPRGELCAGAFHKKWKKIPYIGILRILGLLKNVTFQSTSADETEAIEKYLGARSENIHLLSNIPSIPHDLLLHIPKKNKTGHFIFISRIVNKKNLYSAIGYFREVKGSAFFDIYGPKEDENYWKECKNLINELPENIQVKYKGILNHDEIHQTFCQYDAFLFPTFSENYGHVIAEALLSGCIPIISDQTPWTDMNEANAGWALPLTDANGFTHAIQQVIDMDNTTITNKRMLIKEYSEKKLQLNELKQKYLTVFS